MYIHYQIIYFISIIHISIAIIHNETNTSSCVLNVHNNLYTNQTQQIANLLNTVISHDAFKQDDNSSFALLNNLRNCTYDDIHVLNTTVVVDIRSIVSQLHTQDAYYDWIFTKILPVIDNGCDTNSMVSFLCSMWRATIYRRNELYDVSYPYANNSLYSYNELGTQLYVNSTLYHLLNPVNSTVSDTSVSGGGGGGTESDVSTSSSEESLSTTLYNYSPNTWQGTQEIGAIASHSAIHVWKYIDYQKLPYKRILTNVLSICKTSIRPILLISEAMRATWNRGYIHEFIDKLQFTNKSAPLYGYTDDFVYNFQNMKFTYIPNTSWTTQMHTMFQDFAKNDIRQSKRYQRRFNLFVADKWEGLSDPINNVTITNPYDQYIIISSVIAWLTNDTTSRWNENNCLQPSAPYVPIPNEICQYPYINPLPIVDLYPGWDPWNPQCEAYIFSPLTFVRAAAALLGRWPFQYDKFISIYPNYQHPILDWLVHGLDIAPPDVLPPNLTPCMHFYGIFLCIAAIVITSILLCGTSVTCLVCTRIKRRIDGQSRDSPYVPDPIRIIKR